MKINYARISMKGGDKMNVKEHASSAVIDINNFADQLDVNATNPETIKRIASDLRTTADTLNGAIESEPASKK